MNISYKIKLLKNLRTSGIKKKCKLEIGRKKKILKLKWLWQNHLWQINYG